MGVGEQANEVKVKFLSRASALCLLDSQYDKNTVDRVIGGLAVRNDRFLIHDVLGFKVGSSAVDVVP